MYNVRDVKAGGIEFITYRILRTKEGGNPTDEVKTGEFLAMMSLTSRL